MNYSILYSIVIAVRIVLRSVCKQYKSAEVFETIIINISIDNIHDI